MNKSRAFIPLMAFLALAGLFYFVLMKMNKGEYNPRDIPTEFIGRPAPNIDLPNLLVENDRVKSSDYAGKVWLLNIWGTWCPECWKEHDYLMYLSRQGIPILGIDWRDEKADAIDFLKQKGNPFVEVGFDPNSDAAIDWGVYGAPETFLIDAEGIVREKHAGALYPQVWEEKFAKYFQAQKPTE
ncbi:DsbE family thiol:disulfide interchange protein [Thiolapillus sp.]